MEPVRWKGVVKIFVGAAPTQGELHDLEAQLRMDPGPDGTGQDGKGPFYDAYVDNVDRYR